MQDIEWVCHLVTGMREVWGYENAGCRPAFAIRLPSFSAG